MTDKPDDYYDYVLGLNTIYDVDDRYLKEGVHALITIALHSISMHYFEALLSMGLKIIVSEKCFEDELLCQRRLVTDSAEHIQIVFIDKNYIAFFNNSKLCPDGKMFFSKKIEKNQFVHELQRIFIQRVEPRYQEHKRGDCKSYPCSKQLTELQRKILLKLSSGLSYERLSQELNMEYRKLMKHKESIIQKFSLGGACDLTAFARALRKTSN
ncbi:TPA: hypothetical protein NPP82_000984 [Klebsiella quasipneumoniae subsp. quasipneumoniae]|nr:hypothetical protein [Klebsiella quasipneumoniae subsp. quasipneumoniae]HCI6832339.1 hypothetical protein [Klebsiella quasipneumoniae subsp. quasipneumoniae]